jgi:hypothetical protein
VTDTPGDRGQRGREFEILSGRLADAFDTSSIPMLAESQLETDRFRKALHGLDSRQGSSTPPPRAVITLATRVLASALLQNGYAGRGRLPEDLLRHTLVALQLHPDDAQSVHGLLVEASYRWDDDR